MNNETTGSLRLPHLRPFQPQPIVFITAVTAGRRPLLTCPDGHEILRAIWARSRQSHGWVVGRYVLMPDHVHVFARSALDGTSLARWVQAWKSISSRALAAALPLRGPVWQKDYFDRYLRSAENYSSKWEYVWMNPVRKGFVREAAAWPWQGVIEDLMF